jgi:hypothetical protein
MRSLFLLLLGGTAGVIVGVLIVTVDPLPGGSGDPNDPVVIGIGSAGVWLTEEAFATLLERELDVTSAEVEIAEEGLLYVRLEPRASVGQPLLPNALTLDPEVVDGTFALLLTDSRGGAPLGVESVIRLMTDEVIALIEPAGGRLSYRLTAITTTGNRMTLELEPAGD